MIKLSEAIKNLFKNQQTPLFLMGSIENSWEKIVGEKISKVTKIIKLENHTLFIKCKNPTWKQELQYQKQTILQKIQNHTKEIKNIIII